MSAKAIYAVVAVIVFFCGVTAGHIKGTMEANSKWGLRWEERNNADLTAQVEADKQRVAEEDRRSHERQEIIINANNQVSKANADAVNARNAFERLHSAVQQAIAKRPAEDRAATSGGQAGRSVTAVLSDLFRRADQRAGDLAIVADRSRQAGLTCERLYNSLQRP